MSDLSDDGRREIERLKNVAIKPHWASDAFAQIMAIDVISRYGIEAIPALTEISEQAVGQARRLAIERITQLNSPNPASAKRMSDDRLMPEKLH